MNVEENKKSNSEIIIEKMDEDCNSSQIYKNRLRSVVRNINNKINNSKNNKNVDNNYVDKHKIKKVYKTKKPINNEEQIHLINSNTDIIKAYYFYYIKNIYSLYDHITSIICLLLRSLMGIIMNIL